MYIVYIIIYNLKNNHFYKYHYTTLNLFLLILYSFILFYKEKKHSLASNIWDLLLFYHLNYSAVICRSNKSDTSFL